ncbi:Hsp70 protein that interacts with Zuo1p [Pichia californica]|uniref:Hsp70 protein that interacts with Zuo1p n=1 Tax=Pichia californica TaxID=460514 RepID=A0A9P7BEP3_9ASCO|nr:Hsp70 protein that interacts with Zuo1p [[Candida] californica]KAG0687290.1 Hsp70 protein that interacts with Zuo1p [[Candida] californica]
MATIGIAFGNSTTSFATIKDGKVDVIANPDGERFISSALSYVDGDEYHGQQALAQLVRNPRSTIVNFRDFIGVPFTDINAENSKYAAHPVELNGKVAYEINGNKLSIEEIVKRHLKQIKNAAEDYLGQSIESVVITVPTNFTDIQKEDLIRISNDAGLKVKQLINEPASALLAHLSNKEQFLEDKLYVVADFGGIRSDAAVISVRGGIMTLLATEHSTKLGGQELDEALIDFFATDFTKKFKADAKKTEKSYSKLAAAAIITKKTLSNVQSASVSVDSLAEGFDYMSSINRLRFELVGRKIFSEMNQFIESLVHKAGLETLDIESVLLVGGTSNIPKVANTLSLIFPESTEIIAPAMDSKLPNPNELNCRGAAIQASLIAGFDYDEVKESLSPIVVNTEHISSPIGIKDVDGKFLTILPRETAYPIKKSISFETTTSNVEIQFFEGQRTIKETVLEVEKFSDDEDDEDEEEEAEIVKEVEYIPGTLLGKMVLDGVTSGSKVEVIVQINKDGKLHLTARSGSVVVKGEVSQSA